MGEQGPGQGANAKPRILVVDDEAFAREILRRFFVRQGFDVDEARDGSEAVDRIDRCPPDLLVTDWTMPHLDGRGLIGAVKNTRPALPVIVVSGDPLGDAAIFCRDTGVPFFEKAVDLPALLAKIRQILSN